MTHRPDFHLGDVGTRYTMLLRSRTKNRALDISGASSKTIRFEKPDASTVDKTAEFTTDGTDGKIYYEWQTDDLDQEGDWFAQGIIVDGIRIYSTDVEEFEVGPNIAEPVP